MKHREVRQKIRAARASVIAVIATIAGCAKTVSYTQEVALSANETAVVEFEAEIEKQCEWGQHCGDANYFPVRRSFRVLQPERWQQVSWSGGEHAPAFLGTIDKDLYLVLFADRCYGHAGQNAAHPVFRWNEGHWERVPRTVIPAGTLGNIPRNYPTPAMQGRRYSLSEVEAQLEESAKDIYRKAFADLDFDRRYAQIFSRCAGQHDRQ
jgi:hypothetical protein